MATTADYSKAYEIAVRMMADPVERGFLREWSIIAQHCLLASSNAQNLTVTYPVSLSKKKGD